MPIRVKKNFLSSTTGVTVVQTGEDVAYGQQTAVPHVLIILDCCFAANAARDTSEGTTKELLAACGRETPITGVSDRSFTATLIDELQAFGQAPFTVAMLHSRLMTIRWRLNFTPFYTVLSEHNRQSIELVPLLPAAESSSTDSQESNSVIEEKDARRAEDHESPIPERNSISRLENDTRILLAISVAGGTIPDVSKWKSWLTTNTPWDVSRIDIEGIYEGHSIMVLVSLPTAAWDCLPERAAYRFVGFVKSKNLAIDHSSSEPTTMGSDTQNKHPPMKPLPDASTSKIRNPWNISFIDYSRRKSQNKRALAEARFDPSKQKRRLSVKPRRSLSSLSLSSSIFDDSKDSKRKLAETRASYNARTQGLHWEAINELCFPIKHPFDGRPRYKMRKRLRPSNPSRLVEAYKQCREQIWTVLGNEISESWQWAEIQCMGLGLSLPGVFSEAQKRFRWYKWDLENDVTLDWDGEASTSGSFTTEDLEHS
ncbi:MAG: hypothetical protein Q9222_003389 [Ikaeria aurantiellina]